MTTQIALGDTPCQMNATEVSESHATKMDDLENVFASNRVKLTEKQLSKFKDLEKRERYRHVQKQLIKRARIDAVRKDHDKHLLEGLDELVAAAAPDDLCEDMGIYWTSSDKRVKSFEEKLANLDEELIARHSIESLGRKEGLAIIAMYVRGHAQKIHLNKRGSFLGGTQIGPITNDQYFRVIKLPAGEYNWSRITVGMRYINLQKRDLSFKVVAGKLNYTGVFMYETVGLFSAKSDINDRTSIVMEIMESRHPDLLERYEMKNGLVPNDKFLDFYASEKSRIAGAAQ